MGLFSTISSSFQKSRFRILRPLIYGSILLPIIILSAVDFWLISTNLTDLTLARREALVQLGTVALDEKFDHVAAIGTTFTSDARYAALIAEDRWEEAIAPLASVPTLLPYIDRIFVADPNGILMADTPARPGVRGQDFSARDWYRGVVASGQPYVSEIYRRTAEPQLNVVAVAIPTKTPQGNLASILVLQVRIDTFLEWSKQIDIGSSGVLFFADQHGNVAGHPRSVASGPIVNLGDEEYVQRAQHGQRGTIIVPADIAAGQPAQVISFAPVLAHNWSAFIQEPNPPAFAVRDASLRRLMLINGVAFVGLIILISFLERMMRTSHRSHEREGILLESIGDALVAIDRAWIITLWNGAAERLTGWTRAEVIGRSARDILHFIGEQDRKERITFIEEAMVRGRRTSMDSHTLLVTKSGEDVPVGDSATPIIEEDGSISGAIIIFRNTAQERENLRLRSDFSYASHQFRTPATTALWQLELARKERNAAKRNASIDTASRALRSIEKLSNHLVEVAALDQGIVFARPAKAKLATIIDQAVAALDTEAQAQEVEVVVAPFPANTFVYTDAQMLTKVLLEILQNAILYSPRGGRVELNTTVEKTRILIEVVDQGRGMSSEQQALVFTKYFRGSNTQIAGTGLGLFLAREYVKLLNGKIWFTSQEGKGSTFAVSVPMKPGD